MKIPASTDFRTTEQIIHDEIEKDKRRNHSSQPISLTRDQEDEIGLKFIDDYLGDYPIESCTELHKRSEEFSEALKNRDYEKAARISGSELSPSLIMSYEKLRWYFNDTH